MHTFHSMLPPLPAFIPLRRPWTAGRTGLRRCLRGSPTMPWMQPCLTPSQASQCTSSHSGGWAAQRRGQETRRGKRAACGESGRGSRAQGTGALCLEGSHTRWRPCLLLTTLPTLHCFLAFAKHAMQLVFRSVAGIWWAACAWTCSSRGTKILMSCTTTATAWRAPWPS